jgi:thiamine biosynthesis protein ThiI
MVLYRRIMMRISAELAASIGAQALITGDSLGQVASQTIENIRAVDAALEGVEVFRPLIGMDKQEIMDEAKRIGTYEISARQHQDCCVLFSPRAPATRSDAGRATHAESDLDMDALVGKALAGTETRVFEIPDLA